jgi:hypothetical protein
MNRHEAVPIVRCRLGGQDQELTSSLRYVPLAEFGLWRHLMETRHHRPVIVEAVSIWIAEEATRWNSGFQPEDLEPVLRVRLERPGPHGVPIRIERFFPAETYPRAQEALLAHFSGQSRPRYVSATPGYFVPADTVKSGPVARSA